MAGESLGRCLATVKMYFELHNYVLLILRFFGNYYALFGRDQRSQFKNNTFSLIVPALKVLGICKT